VTWGAVAIAGATVVSGYMAGQSAESAAESASDAQLQAAREAEALNVERYGQAQDYLSPYISRELTASNQLMYELGLGPHPSTIQAQVRPEVSGSPATYADAYSDQLGSGLISREIRGELQGLDIGGTQGSVSNLDRGMRLRPEASPTGGTATYGGATYADSPAYLQSMSAYDKIEEERIAAVNQGAAGAGSLYSGARGKALAEVGGSTQLARAGAENQFYNNYINMLQGLANPASTTNLSSLGVNQAATIGSQNIAAQTAASNYALQGTAAQSAATADIIGGIGSAASAYLNQPQQPNYGAYGGGASANIDPNQYGGYV